jgi:hypothetical protein
MNKDEIDVYKISSLGIGSDLNADGYVIFYESRACNIKFYEWLNKSILIPFIFMIK